MEPIKFTVCDHMLYAEGSVAEFEAGRGRLEDHYCIVVQDNPEILLYDCDQDLIFRPKPGWEIDVCLYVRTAEPAFILTALARLAQLEDDPSIMQVPTFSHRLLIKHAACQ